jgi:hypothetical protein
MLSISQPSFPPIDSFLERVRTTDYRRLALSIWGAFVTACVYVFIAGQLTRRAYNFLAPHLLTFLRAAAHAIETTLPVEAAPTTPPVLRHPPQQTKPQSTRRRKATAQS